jgi:hypothetical protein
MCLGVKLFGTGAGVQGEVWDVVHVRRSSSTRAAGAGGGSQEQHAGGGSQEQHAGCGSQEQHRAAAARSSMAAAGAAWRQHERGPWHARGKPHAKLLSLPPFLCSAALLVPK